MGRSLLLRCLKWSTATTCKPIKFMDSFHRGYWNLTHYRIGPQLLSINTQIKAMGFNELGAIHHRQNPLEQRYDFASPCTCSSPKEKATCSFAKNTLCANIQIFWRDLRTFMLPCIVTDFFFNNQPDALIFQIYSVTKLYMFRAFSLSIVRSFLLYFRHW